MRRPKEIMFERLRVSLGVSCHESRPWSRSLNSRLSALPAHPADRRFPVRLSVRPYRAPGVTAQWTGPAAEATKSLTRNLRAEADSEAQAQLEGPAQKHGDVPIARTSAGKRAWAFAVPRALLGGRSGWRAGGGTGQHCELSSGRGRVAAKAPWLPAAGRPLGSAAEEKKESPLNLPLSLPLP
jgi:hypothetical protein